MAALDDDDDEEEALAPALLAAAETPPCLSAAVDCCDRERRAERRAWRRAIADGEMEREREKAERERKLEGKKSETLRAFRDRKLFFLHDDDAPPALAPVPTRRGRRGAAGAGPEAVPAADCRGLPLALPGLGRTAVAPPALAGEEEAERGKLRD